MTDEIRHPATLGLRAHKGGAVVVALAVEDDVPRLLLSTVLDTHRAGDPLSFAPYGSAFDLPRGPDGKASPAAAALVAEGRRRQDVLAMEGLAAILRTLDRDGARPAMAALLVNRAGWVTDLLDYSLGWPEHVPVAEGLAVRDALRAGIAACGLALGEVDEKSLPDLAQHVLGLPSGAIDTRLKALGAAHKPWRKEHKLAALAAWVTLATP